MSAFRVQITDQLASGLVGTPSASCEISALSEAQARSLIRMLLGRRTLDGAGPWRQAIAGGQRVIELGQEP